MLWYLIIAAVLWIPFNLAWLHYNDSYDLDTLDIFVSCLLGAVCASVWPVAVVGVLSAAIYLNHKAIVNWAMSKIGGEW